MNTTVLALQEEQVLAAVGRPGAKPSVQALYRAPAHGGGMENWERAVGALWQAHDGQPVAADYLPLGTDADGRQQLFCAACRKETMAGYLAMADRLGLHLGSVTVPMAGRLRLLRAMPSLQSMTFVCLCFEGSSVLSLLVENGAYRYSSRSRVFSEPGTLDFGTEMTRSVSGTMQFHTTGRPASPLTDVFYAGCPDDDFEVCLAGIRELGLRVSRLPECPAFRTLPNGERLSDWLGCAEALIR